MRAGSERLTAVTWRKSTHSNEAGGSCLEVADGVAGVVPVRDSKRCAGPVLVFPAASWHAFVGVIGDRSAS
ncbi:hypothetical protein GCM10023347_47320 [Streptomyces chumphonensis]|uniref:DUF397 domain-containing protein n=1 Tax=Streptomyces chumphonensis TaxID=1214925 RepID=A0A927F0I7_9ACTN|nr:DUF397 domain-containing protein [Streptomyces chumphonensis]MBD3932903.1 DUF397 domain-containing protein [Streptomyces chumphonensis]